MYVGIDYHKRYAVATSMDDKGKVVETVRLKNEPKDLIGSVDRLPEVSKIAIEATGNWYYFYELLEGKSPEIHLARPLKTRAIAEARIKTDKIDSTILAHLLRTDLLPESYIPPREIRDIREVLRYRASLVALRTSLKNWIHAILSKNGIVVEYSDILGKRAKAKLKTLEVRNCYRLGIDGYIRLTETLQQLIDEVSETIEEIVENNPQAKLLTTIHGIGYYSALLIVSEIRDIHRFPNAKKLSSYAGLVTRVYSSGDKTRHGSITKLGSIGSKISRPPAAAGDPDVCRREATAVKPPPTGVGGPAAAAWSGKLRIYCPLVAGCRTVHRHEAFMIRPL